MFPLQQINYNVKSLLHIQIIQRAKTDKLYPINQRGAEESFEASDFR